MQLSDSRSYLGINALGSIGRISWSSFGGFHTTEYAVVKLLPRLGEMKFV